MTSMNILMILKYGWINTYNSNTTFKTTGMILWQRKNQLKKMIYQEKH